MMRSMRIWALAIFSPIGLPPANTESCKSTLREDRRRSPKDQKYRCWCRCNCKGEGEGKGESKGESESEDQGESESESKGESEGEEGVRLQSSR